MSPKEYKLMRDGHFEKEELETKKRAQLAAWIINPFVKGQVTLDKLLNKKRTEEDAEASKEAFDKAPDTLSG